MCAGQRTSNETSRALASAREQGSEPPLSTTPAVDEHQVSAGTESAPSPVLQLWTRSRKRRSGGALNHSTARRAQTFPVGGNRCTAVRNVPGGDGWGDLPSRSGRLPPKRRFRGETPGHRRQAVGIPTGRMLAVGHQVPANRNDTHAARARITPRRSPVRVRLAPSKSSRPAVGSSPIVAQAGRRGLVATVLPVTDPVPPDALRRPPDPTRVRRPGPRAC
jgi:hypothetical protein